MKRKNIYLVTAVVVLIIASLLFATNKGLLKPSKTLAPNKTQGPTQQTFGDQYDFGIANPQCFIGGGDSTFSFEIKNIGTALMEKGKTVTLNLSAEGNQVRKEVITERVVPQETSSTYQLTLEDFPDSEYNLTVVSKWTTIVHDRVVKCEKK